LPETARGPSPPRVGSFCDTLIPAMQEDNGTFHTPNVGAKIGPILEKARMERGLTLEEAEQATKIRKRYLSGLEREDYGVLPDAVYARGFLKTYANYLGLDGEELARELRDRRKPRRERSNATYGAPAASEFDRPLVNPGGLRKKERRKVSGTTIRTLLVAVLALAAVVGSLYYVGRGAQSKGESPEQQAPPRSEQQPAAEEGPQGGPQGNAQGGRAGDQPAPPPQPETLTVQVRVEGDPSWLSILADGELSYEQIAEPGFSQTFRAQREISIKTGNAGAVGVVVNGQDLGRLGESGEVLTRDFTLKTAT
jgi:cytoskeleton protein RodZ